MYEERYAGLFCHYILEVDGKDLVNSIGDSNSSDDDDMGDAEGEGDKRSELRKRKRRMQSRRSQVWRQVDNRVEHRMNDLS